MSEDLKNKCRDLIKNKEKLEKEIKNLIKYLDSPGT